MLAWLKRFFMGTTAPVADVTPPPREPMRVSEVALAEARASYGEPLVPWKAPRAPHWARPEIAMDASLTGMYDWASAGAFSEGLGFLGYAYLSELSQRPEYRRIVEIIAAEATRKWIKITGADEDRVTKIETALKRFSIQAKFRELAEHDGFFGRAQLFVDMGHKPNDEELSKPLMIRKEKIGKGKVQNFKVIEPFWSYPGSYESANPLHPDYYRPKFWYVMSAQVDASRLLSVIGREMPDMLKPAYMFGGLSLTQMAKPYVDNWIRTRQSVSDLLHSFSTMVLSTDMSSILSGANADQLMRRLEMFNRMRDNRGIMAVNKDSEELTNITTPLSGLDALQAQAQEQMASVSGIPLVVLLGVTPSGLNASSDGEIQTFYATIKAYQERVFRGPLQTVLEIVQLDLDGEIDPEITFEFIDLWEQDETEAATVRKSDADVDVAYVTGGIVSADEVRERISQDENSPYFGVDLSAPAPELPDDADVLEGDDDEDPEPDGDKPAPAQDEGFEESKHPRAANGQFGSGGKNEAVATVTKALPPAGSLPSPKAVEQPFSSWDDAKRMGEEGLAAFQKLLGGIADRLGLDRSVPMPEALTDDHKGDVLLIAPLKSEKRAAEKVETDYAGDWSKIKDVVRGTIGVERVEDIPKMIEAVTAAGLMFVAQPKNNFAKPTPVEYRDINTLVQLPNGMVAELQFNVKSMIVAKTAAHKPYEAMQDLQRKYDSEEPNDKWTADDNAAYEKAVAAQKAIYSKAWDRAG